MLNILQVLDKFKTGEQMSYKDWQVDQIAPLNKLDNYQKTNAIYSKESTVVCALVRRSPIMLSKG